MNKLPLIEKTRPKEFDELVGIDKLDRIKALISNPADMPNLLFYGPAGTGKTTTAKIILEKLKPIDFIRINGSDTTGVDTIRERVYNFITSKSTNAGKPKIIWIEEFDYQCLDPETKIIVGTLDNRKIISIKDVPKEGTNIISYNTEKKKLENDFCYPLIENNAPIYIVELEDGRTIEATLNHPFFVLENGKIIEKKLKDLSTSDYIIDVSDEINETFL